MLQGYYSLVQYCPDWTRLEVCNIGVMLFCPETRFLDVMMTRNYQNRVRAIFGKDHSFGHIQTFKDSFAERIRAEKDCLSSLEALKNFIANRANSFTITEPRSIAIGDPEQELRGLFTEIFGEQSKVAKEKQVSTKEQFYQTLEKKLGGSWHQRVWIKFPRIEVSIPGFRQSIQPCAGFLNGMFNFVLNRKLTPENSFKMMSSDMMIGRFLRAKKGAPWGEQSLIILADTEGSSEVKQQIETFRPIMQEHQTNIFTSYGDIVTTIEKEAQVLSEEVREYLNQKTLSI